MPREQRVELNKGSPIEVEAGTFKSKPSGSVSMPYVAPKKSPGQALAEGVGMAAKALAKIGQASADEKGKRHSISQRNKGILAGRTKAGVLIDSAKTLLREGKITLDKDPEQKNKLSIGEWYALEIGKANDKLGEADGIHSSYLEGFLSTLGYNLSGAQASNEKLISDKKDEQALIETKAGMLQQYEQGIDGATIYDELQQTSALNMTKSQYGKLYVSTFAAVIKQKAQDNPLYDGFAAIKRTLSIITKKDGIDFATHPEYGPMIDTLVSSLTTLNKARATAADDAKTEVENNWVNSSVWALVVGNPTLEQISTIKGELESMTETGIGTEKFSKVAIALDAVLDRQGFASVSNPEAFYALTAAAKKGNLNHSMLQLNKSAISRKDYLSILKDQAKYEADFADETKKALIVGVNNARRAGKGRVATLNSQGLVVTIGKDKGGNIRAFQFEQQYDDWIESYMVRNKNERPTSNVAYKKASEIANSVNSQWSASQKKPAPKEVVVDPNIGMTTADGKKVTGKKWAPEAAAVQNFEFLKPLIENSDELKIKELIGDGIISLENAAELYKLYK